DVLDEETGRQRAFEPVEVPLVGFDRGRRLPRPLLVLDVVLDGGRERDAVAGGVVLPRVEGSSGPEGHVLARLPESAALVLRPEVDLLRLRAPRGVVDDPLPVPVGGL